MKTKIRKSITAAFVAIICITTFQSCQKYPDGPSFSLRSRAERLSNTWKVDNYKVNSTDLTSLVANYTETYTKDGSYSNNWGSKNEAGLWTFINHASEIQVSNKDTQDIRIQTILKLEEKSLWFYYMKGNDKHEFHMIPK